MLGAYHPDLLARLLRHASLALLPEPSAPVAIGTNRQADQGKPCRPRWIRNNVSLRFHISPTHALPSVAWVTMHARQPSFLLAGERDNPSKVLRPEASIAV